jgi:ADP-heptose:LPS heptosyltransferase
MKSILPSPVPDKVILVHNGALGDFLLIWPSAWAIGKAFPRARLYWAGSGERLAFLEPLGITPCPPDARKALARIYGAARWPGELAQYTCVWFVVDRDPDAPAHENLWSARAVRDTLARADAIAGLAREDALESPANRTASECVQGPLPVHVRDRYLSDLALRGVSPAPGWLEGFRRLFASGRASRGASPGFSQAAVTGGPEAMTGAAGSTVLLFPGAGHPLKQWPLVQFFQLADMLNDHGLEPLFVLGPAELERGLIPAGRPHAAPANLGELTALLLGARAAIGPDTGPMHMAGMLGVPGVALFGPTDPAVWGPIGIRCIRLGLPCSPCTTACTDLDCPRPLCMEGFSPELVLEELRLALA